MKALVDILIILERAKPLIKRENPEVTKEMQDKFHYIKILKKKSIWQKEMLQIMSKVKLPTKKKILVAHMTVN